LVDIATSQEQTMKFVQCPNGMVWPLDNEGLISGTVLVPNYLEKETPEDRLDAIAEAATGSLVGLTNFSDTYLGNDLVSFKGVPEILDYAPEGCTELDEHSPELRAALAAQYGLDEMEVEHALDNLDTNYGQECTLSIAGSRRAIRCPASPAECEYVRVVIDGFEIAYWHMDEWQRMPAEVVGAFLGAARGG
jgi:hypothetical protein